MGHRTPKQMGGTDELIIRCALIYDSDGVGGVHQGDSLCIQKGG